MDYEELQKSIEKAMDRLDDFRALFNRDLEDLNLDLAALRSQVVAAKVRQWQAEAEVE